MKQKIISLVSIFILIPIYTCFSQNVNWISITTQNKWVQQESLQLYNNKNLSQFDVEIFLGKTQQTIDGWGGCFNELGWDVLMSLDSTERYAVLKNFFDLKEGLKYNICRMPNRMRR